MELPLQITSHDFALSPGIEAEIREHADRLDIYYNRIMRCRVVVEAPVVITIVAVRSRCISISPCPVGN